MSAPSNSHSDSSVSSRPAWIEIVRQKVETLRFGAVQIVVHDGKVTQIERTERTRLGGSRDSSA
ncbi:MAG: hypothetical protein RIQ79_1718 [Verrucomicrobiota bacterium]